MNAVNVTLPDHLRRIVGHRYVLVGERATHTYRVGLRYAEGPALAVVRPGTLVELWRVLQACVAANAAVLLQAANTGITGGSTPAPEGYDRELVIVNNLRITGLHLVDGGRQAICLPGTTLYQLEAALRAIGREPHSVIGSSCFGASVAGGICNNSGGALIRRGPAYTELALYARLDERRQLQLVNHLGLELGADPEAALEQLQRGGFAPAPQPAPPITSPITSPVAARASDGDYAARVRQLDATRPARFNADTSRLFEASGCAGKLAVFAIRVDTFPKDEQTRTFYVGSNDPGVLAQLRRTVLRDFGTLPVSGEYIHREAFDIASVWGKGMFLAVRWLGTDRLPWLYALRNRLAGLAERLRLQRVLNGTRITRRLTQMLPDHLPPRMRAFRDRYEHHLLLKVPDAGIEEARRLFSTLFPSPQADVFECTAHEAECAFLHRFAVAGAANSYLAAHPREVGALVSIDAALLPMDGHWHEFLPDDLRADIHARVVCGHYFCHVLHLDFLVRRGADIGHVKRRLKQWLDGRGAKFPAEHNFGQMYEAPPEVVAFYKALDPTNTFNPGVGATSRNENWREA
jgi:D-lactate dehydrogenase